MDKRTPNRELRQIGGASVDAVVEQAT